MRDRNGFILVFALVIIALVILSLTALFFISYNDLRMSTVASNSMKAYYIAEAGLAKKFMDLRAGNTSAASGTFTLGGGNSGTFSVAVTLVSGGNFATYRLDSTGTYKGASRQLSLTVRQTSFSRFAYLSNSENRMFWFWKIPVWFVTGDTLTGPVFTNDQLNIYGDPVFEGPVSSVNSEINYYHGGPPDDNPEFRDSLTLGALPMQMPSSLGTLDAIQTAAASAGGLTLTRSASPAHMQSVVFLSDGTLNYDNGNTISNHPVPANGAIYVTTGDVEVSGILNGNATVGSPSNIFIANNLIYNTDPRTDPAATDMLGLVAQNNVYVAPGAPYDIEIDAYIVAMNTSFGVYDYASVLKGTLSIYGGVTQSVRGAVGTFNPATGEKASGYTKNYEYDPRMANIAPAYFPPAKDANGRFIYIRVLWSED